MIDKEYIRKAAVAPRAPAAFRGRRYISNRRLYHASAVICISIFIFMGTVVRAAQKEFALFEAEEQAQIQQALEYEFALRERENGGIAPARALPIQISIPAIGVDAEVRAMGADERGDMAVPVRRNTVGWYQLGSRPGERGSAVIAGHVSAGSLMPGVFGSLDELKAGDQIVVVDDQGKKLTYTVTKVAAYLTDETPLQSIFLKSDGVYLNLITCAGNWLSDEQEYNQRLVVYSTLVE